MSVRRVDSDGEPVFGVPTSVIPASSEEVAATLPMNVKLQNGEWFLDETAGLAWVDTGTGEPRIFGEHADAQLLESELKRAILSTPGVAALLSFDMAFDHDARRADVSATISDIYGGVLPIHLVIP